MGWTIESKGKIEQKNIFIIQSKIPHTKIINNTNKKSHFPTKTAQNHTHTHT